LEGDRHPELQCNSAVQCAWFAT